MPLVKSFNGLIEEENFYIEQATDFLGNNMDYYIIDNNLVMSNGTIEREFLHNEFVIEIREKFKPKTSKDAAFFYVSNGEKFGILEKYSSSAQNDYCYWKLIYYDGFLQTYKSQDGLLWKNIGGAKVDNISLQGFEVVGTTPFMFGNYKVYKNSYITIYNYPNNYKAELIDVSNNTIKQSTFRNNQCKIFLDYCFKGKIKVLDENNNVVSLTDLMELNYGDEFFLSDYNIELYYGKSKVTSTTLIKTFLDTLTVKNVSDISYKDLNITVTKPNNNFDVIRLSLDGTNFYSSIIIDELNSDESKNIYVKVDSPDKTTNILYKNFDINIT